MEAKNINQLVTENLSYVKSLANRFKGKGVDFDDLVSEGYMAMTQAAQKYDTERGTQFIAYAAPFIRKAHHDDVPPHLCQFAVFFLVALLVAPYLILPKLHMGLRHAEVLAVVTMPKATIHEDARAVFAQHDVGVTWQAVEVQPVAETESPKVFPHGQFWLCVSRMDGGHHLASLFF